MAEVTAANTILVAVNDSPAAFAAATVAIAFATKLSTHLHVVTIIDPMSTLANEPQTEITRVAGQREAESDSVLGHVAALAAKAGLAVTTSRRVGKVAAGILDEARMVGAEMIVMASVDRPGHAIPKVGSHTMRVLEFASVPVLVVPGAPNTIPPSSAPVSSMPTIHSVRARRATSRDDK